MYCAGHVCEVCVCEFVHQYTHARTHASTSITTSLNATQYNRIVSLDTLLFYDQHICESVYINKQTNTYTYYRLTVCRIVFAFDTCIVLIERVMLGFLNWHCICFTIIVYIHFHTITATLTSNGRQSRLTTTTTAMAATTTTQQRFVHTVSES